MKKVLVLSMMCLFLTTSIHAVLVGSDSFDYANGPIAGQSGGEGWDWQRVTQTQGTTPSSWQNLAGGTADVVDGVLTIHSGSGWNAVRRIFSGSNEWDNAFQNSGIVYFASDLIVNVEQNWLGLSAQDGEWNERIKFGMPYQESNRQFGINNENTNTQAWTGIPIVFGQQYRIVGVVDFDNGQARMWVDPDPSDYDIGPGQTSADAILDPLDMTNWISGVRLGSDQQTTWDNVITSTEFVDTFVPNAFADRPSNPSPVNGDVDVLVESPFITFSWTVAKAPSVADPNVYVVDPNLVSQKLYISSGSPTDPNVNILVQDNIGWDGSLQSSHQLTYALLKDRQYFWRVDSVRASGPDLTGYVWTFDTEKSTPIVSGPDYTVVPAGSTAQFIANVTSPTTPTAEWYKVGVIPKLQDGDDSGDISISPDTLTLSIANAEIADEGGYYCIVNNASGIPVQSVTALLGIERRIAYWPFEDNDANSIVPNSPTSVLFGDPVFTTGVIGNGMEFDADGGSEDLIYTDPDEASYFDICNYSMTVGCWIKAPSAHTWGPMVARNGEDGEGWQLRHNGNTLDRISFTTRGTGNDDGTGSNRTVYDDAWHWAVGTFDGGEKRVYIDGVLSRVYSGDDGSLSQEFDAVSDLVNSSASPISIAGRVKGSAGTGLNIENWTVTAGIYDEIEIYNYVKDAATIAQEYATKANTSVCPENPVYDLDGDCDVDLDEVADIASEWLEDNTVNP